MIPTVPGWATGVLLWLMVCVVIVGMLWVIAQNAPLDPYDVPCQSCINGYGEQHECDAPAYCPCDQFVKHTNGPDVCVHDAPPKQCLACWVDGLREADDR